jgi:hypothetical protein
LLEALERASNVLLSPILVSFLLLLKVERGKISSTLVNFRGHHVVPIPAVVLCMLVHYDVGPEFGLSQM